MNCNKERTGNAIWKDYLSKFPLVKFKLKIGARERMNPYRLLANLPDEVSLHKDDRYYFTQEANNRNGWVGIVHKTVARYYDEVAV